jgi:antirestriction protein
MPEIYVACLASYNSGQLHGEWINAAQDADILEEEILLKVLMTSPEMENAKAYQCADQYCNKYFFVEKGTFFPSCRHCGNDITILVGQLNYTKSNWFQVAEEWAIHDYDDFDHVKLGEYENLEYVSKIAQGIEEHGEVFGAFVGDCGPFDADDDIKEKFNDANGGVYKDLEDFAYEYCESMGEVPQWLEHYIDYERMGRDFAMDYTVVDVSNGIAFFDNR